VIVWVASYPRSGNTFFRIALHRLYDVPTYVVYDVDGVAERIGPELMGFRERPAELERMRADPRAYFVKTHRRREAPVCDEDRAIYLVRDGRDCVVSWARLNAESFRGENDYKLRFADAARTAITRQGGGTTHWGRNVLSWLQSTAPRPAVLRYEELIADPMGSVRRVVADVLPELETVDGASVPSFEELRKLDGGFFRKGTTGTHRTELPAELHTLFWQQPENVAAMELLGYSR
jgi:sulfotransferase family protein